MTPARDLHLGTMPRMRSGGVRALLVAAMVASLAAAPVSQVPSQAQSEVDGLGLSELPPDLEPGTGGQPSMDHHLNTVDAEALQRFEERQAAARDREAAAARQARIAFEEFRALEGSTPAGANSRSYTNVDMLPMTRWNHVTVRSFAEKRIFDGLRSAVNVGDALAGIASGILMGISTLVWSMILGAFQIGITVSNGIFHAFAPAINGVFAEIASVAQGFLVLVLFSVLIGIAKSVARDNKVTASLLRAFWFLVFSAILYFVAVNSQNAVNSGADPLSRGTAAWVGHTALNIIDLAAAPLLERTGGGLLGSGAGIPEGEQAVADMSCEAYSQVLHNRATRSGTSTTLRMLSSLWERTQFISWQRAQFGSSYQLDLPRQVSCYYAESQEGIDAEERVSAMSELAPGAFSPDAPFFQELRFGEGAGQARGRTIIASAACRYSAGSWQVRREYSSSNITPADCTNIFAGSGSDIPVSFELFGEPSKYRSVAGNNDAYELSRSISPTGNILGAILGGIPAVLGALATAYALLPIALGMFISGIAAVFAIGLLLPAILVLMAAQSEKAKVLRKMAIALLAINAMMQMLLFLLMSLTVIIQSAFLAYSTNFFFELLAGFAPLMAFAILNKVMKATGFGGMSLLNMMQLPALATARASGVKQLSDLFRADDSGRSRLTQRLQNATGEGRLGRASRRLGNLDQDSTPAGSLHAAQRAARAYADRGEKRRHNWMRKAGTQGARIQANRERMMRERAQLQDARRRIANDPRYAGLDLPKSAKDLRYARQQMGRRDMEQDALSLSAEHMNLSTIPPSQLTSAQRSRLAEIAPFAGLTADNVGDTPFALLRNASGLVRPNDPAGLADSMERRAARLVDGSVIRGDGDYSNASAEDIERTGVGYSRMLQAGHTSDQLVQGARSSLAEQTEQFIQEELEATGRTEAQLSPSERADLHRRASENAARNGVASSGYSATGQTTDGGRIGGYGQEAVKRHVAAGELGDVKHRDQVVVTPEGMYFLKPHGSTLDEAWESPKGDPQRVSLASSPETYLPDRIRRITDPEAYAIASSEFMIQNGLMDPTTGTKVDMLTVLSPTQAETMRESTDPQAVSAVLASVRSVSRKPVPEMSEPALRYREALESSFQSQKEAMAFTHFTPQGLEVISEIVESAPTEHNLTASAGAAGRFFQGSYAAISSNLGDPEAASRALRGVAPTDIDTHLRTLLQAAIAARQVEIVDSALRTGKIENPSQLDAEVQAAGAEIQEHYATVINLAARIRQFAADPRSTPPISTEELQRGENSKRAIDRLAAQTKGQEHIEACDRLSDIVVRRSGPAASQQASAPPTRTTYNQFPDLVGA